MNAFIPCGDTIQPSVLSVDVYVLLMKTSISYLSIFSPALVASLIGQAC